MAFPDIVMRLSDAMRFHLAAKMIEADGCEGYFSAVQECGGDAAGAALVTWLRSQLNKEDCWPPSDDLIERVNTIMQEAGRLEWK